MSERTNPDRAREIERRRRELRQLEDLPDDQPLPAPVGPSYAPDSPVYHKGDLKALIEARYPDPAVQESVLKSIEAAGTADRILSGELVLPHPADAHRHAHGEDKRLAALEQERRRNL